MLSLIEHEILTAHKTKMLIKGLFFTSKLSIVVLISLINILMPTIICILLFLSKMNFILSRVELSMEKNDTMKLGAQIFRTNTVLFHFQELYYILPAMVVLELAATVSSYTIMNPVTELQTENGKFI